jgi:hypothetical protein
VLYVLPINTRMLLAQQFPTKVLPARYWCLALLILRTLLADENKAAANWENDSRAAPPVTWTPTPNGGAFAVLLACPEPA